jgi:arylsulfatase A-like enzyme
MITGTLRTLLPLLALALASAGHAGNQPGIAGPSPNVVVIYVDDLGYGDLGSYGHHTIQTPHLDKLAGEGMRLTNYYAPAPLCSPSRAALLTGRTPFRSGIRSWIPENTPVQLETREITLATLLKDEGYETFLGGKWHLNGGLGVSSQAQPENHGFDHWLALHAFPIPHNRNPTNFFLNGKPMGEVEGYTAQITIDESIRWLNGRDGSKPLFMYLAMVEPHSTHANPDEYNAMYSQFTRGTPEPIVNGLPQPPLMLLEARGPGEYYAQITYMDAQIGRFLTALDQAGLRDSTIVVFASDNGPVTTEWRNWWEVNVYGSTGGLRGRKGDLYEGGIRVPAFVRWPGHIEPGAVSEALVSGYDLLPTLASMIGFGLPDDREIDGEDVSRALLGSAFQRERPLYWEFDDISGFHYALRDGDWKLLASEDLEYTRLYDLATDQHELLDRSVDQPQILAAMLSKLGTMASSVHSDPLRPDWVQTNREGED